MLVHFPLPKGSIVNGIAVTWEVGWWFEPDQFLIVCDAGVAGATFVKISGGLGLIWVRGNLVQSGHISQPVVQFTLPPGVTADSVLAFTLAQRETSKDQRPDIRLPSSAAEKSAEQNRLELLFTSSATEIRGRIHQRESIIKLLKAKGRDRQGVTLPSQISDSLSRGPAPSEGLRKGTGSFWNSKEDDSDDDEEGSEEDEESVAEANISHFLLVNPGEARLSKEAAPSKQKPDPLLTSVKGLLTGPQVFRQLRPRICMRRPSYRSSKNSEKVREHHSR